MMSEAQGQNGRPTFQDEMESLLYVVLYSALLWQEHGTSRRQLTNIITEMFDRFREFEDGIKDGGDGKLANAQGRVFTRYVRFKNHDLSEWLNTVMDFHSPPPLLEAEYKDKWAHPEQLDAYWHNFLQTHKLESNNRAENKMDQNDIYDSITPPPPVYSPSPECVPSPLPSETPIGAPFPRRKRRIERTADESSGSQPKQARVEKPASVQSNVVRPASVQPSPAQPVSVPSTSVESALATPSEDPTPSTSLRRSPRKHASSQPKPSVAGRKPRKARTAATEKTRRK